MALLLRGTTTDLIDCQVSRLGISEMLDKAPDSPPQNTGLLVGLSSLLNRPSVDRMPFGRLYME